MDSQIIRNELVNTAQKQLNCFDSLIKLSESQESILINGRHGELAGNLSGFDPLLLEFEQLAKREEALRKRLESESDASDVNPLTGALSERASRLRVLTETNRELLSNTMGLIGLSMAVISKVTAEEQMKINPQAGMAIILDQKV